MRDGIVEARRSGARGQKSRRAKTSLMLKSDHLRLPSTEAPRSVRDSHSPNTLAQDSYHDTNPSSRSFVIYTESGFKVWSSHTRRHANAQAAHVHPRLAVTTIFPEAFKMSVSLIDSQRNGEIQTAREPRPPPLTEPKLSWAPSTTSLKATCVSFPQAVRSLSC